MPTAFLQTRLRQVIRLTVDDSVIREHHSNGFKGAYDASLYTTSRDDALLVEAIILAQENKLISQVLGLGVRF